MKIFTPNTIISSVDVNANFDELSTAIGRSSRYYTTTSLATLTPNIDDYSIYELSAQAEALTVAAPTGTPIDKDILIFFIKDNGTTRAITWNASFTNISGLDSLADTVAGKWHTVGAVYNAGLTKWQIVSITTEA